MILKQNVAFDLDGTLVDLMAIFEQELYEQYGVAIKRHNNFYIKTEPTQVKSTAIWKVFKATYKRYKDIPVLNGAQELLIKLYEMTGEPPTIVTARPHWAANDTYKLVDRFLDVPYRLILSNGGGNKLDYLHGIDNFVDDRRKIALELALADKYVYMPKHHYNDMNFEVDNIEYIEGVHELIPEIESLCSVVVRYA
jgi:hypothetical protein